MNKQYLAAVWHSKGDVRPEEKRLRPLGPDELLMKVKAAGICGTDLHLINGEYPGCIPPVVPGHEFAGVIEAAGDESNNWLIGKRVGGDSYLGCGACVYCLQEERQLCRRGVRELGVHLDGGWAEYLILPKENIYLLPDGISLEEAGSGCILNCSMAAVEKVGVHAGDFVLIIGDGPSSLVMLQLARLKGATTVVVAGHRDKRLKLAVQLGADEAIDTREHDVSAILDKYAKEPDVVIDAVGKSETLNLAFKLVRKKGRIHLFGLPSKPLDGLSMEAFIFKEMTLTSSTGHPALWRSVTDYISKGLLQVKPLITHRFTLSEIEYALDFIRQNPNDMIKAILVDDVTRNSDE